MIQTKNCMCKLLSRQKYVFLNTLKKEKVAGRKYWKRPEKILWDF